jgi:hypothetical protein
MLLEMLASAKTKSALVKLDLESFKLTLENFLQIDLAILDASKFLGAATSS